MFENTHSLLNRKLLHLSTVVTFQNVNVPVYCHCGLLLLYMT